MGVTVRMMVRQINKEAFMATMGKGEYPLYKQKPVIHAFSKNGILHIMTKSGEVTRCGNIDEITLRW